MGQEGLPCHVELADLRFRGNQVMSKCTDETCACLVEVCDLRSQGTEVRARKGAWSGFHCFHFPHFLLHRTG